MGSTPMHGKLPSHKGRVTHMHARMHDVTVAVYERHTDRWQAHGGVGDRKTLREIESDAFVMGGDVCKPRLVGLG